MFNMERGRRNMSMKSKLKKANKLWKDESKERAEQEPDWQELPDGRYIAKLTGSELGESQGSGRLQIAWAYKILEGEFSGETVRDYDGLDSEDNLFYLGKKIAKLGYDLPDDLAEELEALLSELESSGPVVRIQLKSKNDFQNVYVQRLLDGHEEEGGEGDGEDDEAGQLPAKEEEEAGDEWEAGMDCLAPWEDEMFPATIQSIEDETATVEGEDGEAWDVDLSELEEVEPEGEGEGEDDSTQEVELEKGLVVEIETEDGDEITGTITFIAKNGETISVKDEDGEVHKKVPVESITSVVKDDNVPDKPKSKVSKKRGSRRTR